MILNAETKQDVEHAPSAKKLMKDNNINPKEVKGSGRDGRIMKEDVILATEALSKKNISANLEHEISFHTREERGNE